MQRKEQEVYSKVMQDQERDAFYWAPPGGESIASACLRVDRVMDILKYPIPPLRSFSFCAISPMLSGTDAIVLQDVMLGL